MESKVVETMDESGLVYSNSRSKTIGGESFAPATRVLTSALALIAFRFRPAFFDALAGARDDQRVCRNIFGDATGSRHVRAPADLYRRHQRRIAADEDAVSDYRAVLVHAVVIAGNGAGADVHAGPDFRVAEISQMLGLRAFAE